MKMGNPSMRKLLQRSQAGEMQVKEATASHGGVAAKSVIFAALTIIAAVVVAFVLNSALANDDESVFVAVLVGALVCLLPMLIMSLVMMFSPRTVKVLGIIYSVLQGGLLGVLVFFIDTFVSGVAFAAVLGTLIVFVISVVLNKMLKVRVRGSALRVFLIAALSFVVLELVMFVSALFVKSLEALFGVYLWIQLASSAVCIIYATIMLLFDLQTADDIVAAGADKSYEWVVAFSLVSTLVYMYVEILELILRLMMIFGKNKN